MYDDRCQRPRDWPTDHLRDVERNVHRLWNTVRRALLDTYGQPPKRLTSSDPSDAAPCARGKAPA
jgi:hypothetical protein